jgi:phage tail-like protein
LAPYFSAAPFCPRRRAELDHVGAYNFLIEINGVTTGAFKGVEGLESETEVIEFQNGEDLILRKRPGRTKYSNITLKRGVIADSELQDWWKAVRNGNHGQRSLSIQLQDDSGRHGGHMASEQGLAQQVEGQRVRRQGQ